jgi:competence protein ComEC
LWGGRVRALGLVPAALGLFLLTTLRPPDVLVSGDGRHVGITGAGAELLVLRASKSDYVRENLTEIAGMAGETRLLSDWPGARCNADFCAVQLERGGRSWQLLIARGNDYVSTRALAAACDRADVVIADRRLPFACRPRWLKADRELLDRTGGLTLDLDQGQVATVSSLQGQHGWWQPRVRARYRPALAAKPANPPAPPGVPPPVQ